MKLTVAYGYDRQSKVPKLGGTNPKSCSRCKKWFAAGKRERVCHGCLRPGEKTRRLALGNHPSALLSLSETAGQGARKTRLGRRVPDSAKVIYSEFLNLTFACPKKDHRYPRLECRVLAYELAAREHWTGKQEKDLKID